MKWTISILLNGLLVTNFFPSYHNQKTGELKGIQRQIATLKQISFVDQARDAALGKIMRIVDQHNGNMADQAKLAISKEVYQMSLKYPNLDVDLICATITHESGRTWDPQVVSKAGALGLMQIMPATGQWLAKYEGIEWTTADDVLCNPIHNIRMGSRYLSALIETYDLEGGLAAYNGGVKRVEMWLAKNKARDILWPETREYIPKVLKIYNEYKTSPM